MANSNGGIVGVTNNTSFGKNTVNTITSTGSFTTQPGTRTMRTLVVGGGGSGGGDYGGGGGAGGVVYNSDYPIIEVLQHNQLKPVLVEH